MVNLERGRECLVGLSILLVYVYSTVTIGIYIKCGGWLLEPLPEDWSPGWYLVPALHHEGVHPAGAVLRTRQQLSGPAPLENIHTKHDTFSSVAEPEQVRAGAEL